jgi:hypothetical protein
MLRYEIYFIINCVAVVATNGRDVRKLPKPALFLLDGSWKRIFKKPWIEVFADFLEAHDEAPSNFELHFPDGWVARIYLTDFWTGKWYWTWTIYRYQIPSSFSGMPLIESPAKVWSTLSPNFLAASSISGFVADIAHRVKNMTMLNGAKAGGGDGDDR